MGRSQGKTKSLNSSSRSRAAVKNKDLVQTSASILASQLHEDWRDVRLGGKGKFFDPCIKTTKDKAWIKANGTDQVDIANTSYQDLPSDWQAENKAAAEAALDAIRNSSNAEEAAAKIHEDRLERNGSRAEEHQRVPYNQLPEKEKEKNRLQATLAVEISSQMLKDESSFSEKGNPEQETEILADYFHDDWRIARESIPFEPHIRTTKDEAWIKANGTDQVDIANTSYEGLPSDWQKENKLAAEAAVDAVNSSTNLEEAAAKIHDAWLKRNGASDKDHQKVSYDQLPESEKGKYRARARDAADVLKKRTTKTT